MYRPVGQAEHVCLWSGRSGVQSSGWSNWTQCCQRIATSATFPGKELCCTSAMTWRWAPQKSLHASPKSGLAPDTWLWAGGGQKKYLGGTDNFVSSKSGVKAKKKVFISNYALWLRAVCSLSGHNSRSGNTFLAERGPTESNDADLGSCPQIQGWRPKNGLRRKIVGFVFAFPRFFRPGTRLYSCLGVTRSIFGGHRPHNALQWHRVCYFLCCWKKTPS